MDATGLDSYGREFKTADEMWREHTGDSSKKTQWYRDGVSYWEGVNPTMDATACCSWYSFIVPLLLNSTRAMDS
ncbi:hypothetical protein LR48_Vigan464s002600 [Vigna angularis]|uniref:Uncharacterized protein n=1 Tax=Phaseolus angularis TaxID=3914 RepID=A0A0L9TCE5_PHAAN|nr:hypothetical protein LR48_Vigan464s002600 [Vigna angularis]